MTDVNWRERKRVAKDLKAIYRAATVEVEGPLMGFAVQRDPRYASISALWRRNCRGVIPFFLFPPEIRKFVCTTNAVESNMRLRRAIEMRDALPFGGPP